MSYTTSIGTGAFQLLVLFKLRAALGEKIFYGSVFPFCFWNIDGAVGRRVLMSGPYPCL